MKSTQPKKKRQHFVPRFYLRKFSFAGDERINAIHIESLQSLPSVGIKGQCQDDYLYGKDPKVENALQDLEGHAAAIIDACITSRSLPKRGTPDDFVLRTYICLQLGRTQSHARKSEELFDKALKTVYGPEWRAQGITQEQIDEVYFGTERPALFTLGMASETVPFVLDLASKLVVAGNLGEFVTSDVPVAKINPYMHGRFHGGVTGLNTRGVVILFPLSPDLLAVFYDEACYRLGSRSNRVVTLTSRADLVALNNIQCLHADETVYHHDERYAAKHLAEFGKVKKRRVVDGSVVHEAFSTTPGDNSSLLHTYQADVPYQPHFAFLSLVKKRRGETGDVAQLKERNPEIVALFEEYQRDVREETSRRGFLDYYTSHLLRTAGLPLPSFIRDPRIEPESPK